MDIRRIEFVSPGEARLCPFDLREPEAGEVMVHTMVTTVSAGTERANLMGDPNVGGDYRGPVLFPRILGYSGAGVIEKVGEGVRDLKVGDRVYTSWGQHAEYHVFPERFVHKLPDDLSFEEGALLHICTFPLAGVRKSRLEIGESAMTVGLGILGMMSIMIQRACGAYPVIASDPNSERRELALQFGADYAFDPTKPEFVDEVNRVTDGRMVNAAVEVTGNGPALDRLLDVMARFGRVALLGCTRDSNFTIDYYHKVHCPGITMVGAHTNARPEDDSSEHFWTECDDITAAMRLVRAGRLPLKTLIRETHSPEEAHEVYSRLAENRFPVCVQFDWRKLN